MKTYIKYSYIVNLLTDRKNATINLNDECSVGIEIDNKTGFRMFVLTSPKGKMYYPVDYQYQAMLAPDIHSFIDGIVTNLNQQLGSEAYENFIMHRNDDKSEERFKEVLFHFNNGDLGDFESKSRNDCAILQIQKDLDIAYSNNAQYIPYRLLLQRGWTDSLIKELGLEPDKDSCDDCQAMYGSGIDVYNMEEVMRLEQTSEFIAAQKAAEANYAVLKEKIKALPVNMLHENKEQMCKDALEHYNHRWSSRFASHRRLGDDSPLDSRVLENVVCDFVSDYSKDDYKDILNCAADSLERGRLEAYISDVIKEKVHQTFFSQAA